MHITNKNYKIEYDPIWDLIAKYTLSDVFVGDCNTAESSTGSLFKTAHELGLTDECTRRILGKITETITGIRLRCNHGDLVLPIQISLFCQRNTKDGNLENRDQRNGGWGYYVIERGKEMPNNSSRECEWIIELYLYKEDG